jgi:hypothetical protein
MLSLANQLHGRKETQPHLAALSSSKNHSTMPQDASLRSFAGSGATLCMRLLLTVVAAYPRGRFKASYFAQPPQALSCNDLGQIASGLNAAVLANAVAVGQPGDALDCISTSPTGHLAAWRRPAALPAPILSSPAAMTECVITTATNSSTD